MFINKVVLFEDHVDIYFNASDDKKTHLQLKEMPEDGELLIGMQTKKQLEATVGSDCLHLAEQQRCKSNWIKFIICGNFACFFYFIMISLYQYIKISKVDYEK